MPSGRTHTFEVVVADHAQQFDADETQLLQADAAVVRRNVVPLITQAYRILLTRVVSEVTPTQFEPENVPHDGDNAGFA